MPGVDPVQKDSKQNQIKNTLGWWIRLRKEPNVQPFWCERCEVSEVLQRAQL